MRIAFDVTEERIKSLEKYIQSFNPNDTPIRLTTEGEVQAAIASIVIAETAAFITCSTPESGCPTCHSRFYGER